MGSLFYAPPDDIKCEKILDAVKRLDLKEQIEVYRTAESLIERLRNPTFNIPVCLFCTPTQEAFLEICSIHQWFDGLRVILLLPDRERETVSRAHRLMPRFVSYLDDGPASVIAVLTKMLSRNPYPQSLEDRWDGRQGLPPSGRRTIDCFPRHNSKEGSR